MEKIKKQFGFTLVEALLIVTIFAVVLTASFSLSNTKIFEDDLQSKILQVSEILERARNNSATGYRGDVWGIKVLDSDALCDNSGDCIMMFKGDSFSSRDASFDVFVQFDSDISGVYINSDQENEFYFDYQSGYLASSTNASIGDQYIVLSSNFGDSQSIVVANSGVVSQFVCGEDQVFDVEGNGYNTVQIGNECWMAENLNTGTMLASVTTDPADNSITEKWCYGDDSANCDIYGGLYSWYEAMHYVVSGGEGDQGICPSGWHVPINYGETDALDDNITGTNLKIGGNSGFDLLMAGARVYSAPDYYDYNVGDPDDTGYFWTSAGSGGSGYNYYIANNGNDLTEQSLEVYHGLSIRCVKDY